MKRNMKKPLVFIMALMMMIMTVLPVSASQATSYTYTLDDNNERVRTQDAYLPDRTITNLGLKNPSDIIIDENNIMYICDTGNTRIVIYDLNSEKVLHIISGDDDIYKGTDFKGFTTPKGIFRTDDGTLYVADGGEKAVFKFDSNYNYLTAFETPTAPIFGDTNYEPSKVAVDKGGNIFIVSEGVNTGIIQLSYTGEFLGYFTSNKTRLTPQQAFLKAIYTKEQEEKSALLNTAPPTFSNIYVDETGTVYTTSMGKGDDLLKKHSTNGGNMFQNAVAAHASLTDVSVDDRGIIYASDTTGYITVYTKSGELIFDFGANVKNLDISGLFSSLTTIATDNNYNIWTADGDKGYLQSFIPTDYAKTIYKALDEYENGEYAAAEVAATEEARMGLWELFTKGGWLMWPLLILGGVTIFIFVERFLAIRKASTLDMNFMNRIRDFILDGKIAAAVDLCRKTDTPIARMIEKGIERLGRPMSDVQSAIENVANLEVSKLENGLPSLATIAGGAPMIGFLGTVLGMVQTFMDMSAAGGTVDMSLLAGGMYVAMVTTVAGLIVGIPAYFGYNYLVARIEKLVFQMEANSIAFMDILNQPVQK